MTQWYLQPILDSYAAVALIALALVLLLLVRPGFGRLDGRQQGLLVALRLGVIALAVLAMLRPTHISTTVKPQSAVLVVLLDQSRSMQLPHASGGQSRWQAQREALENARPQLQRLAEELEVKLYGYDSGLYPIELDDGQIQLPEQPEGQQTDIGSNLHDAVRRELGKRLAGVVLLGDGAQTAFDPQVEIHEAARELARMGYPLYTIAFGLSGDAAQARDVAVENLPQQYTVFVKNELVVRGMLRVRGYVNQDIPVELLVEDSDGNQQVVAKTQQRAQTDGQQLAVEMSYVPQEPGQYKLTLRAEAQPGELVIKNNELSAFLTVLEGGLKVAYLYGSLLGEQGQLRESINASPDIELHHQWIHHGQRERDRWPRNLEEFLDDSTYDAVLIEDVAAAALGPENLARMAELVEQGKGLMMIGGYYSFGPGGYQATPLADVLPVVMGRFERQELGFDQPISEDLHLPGEVAMVPVRSHPVVRLAPEQENVQLWSQLPALNGANRFQDVKPRAQVLAETPDGSPLLVAGEYGQGRVLAFAGNTTLRWWRHGHESEHRRFWRQVILWLTQRDDLSQDDVWVKLRQRRYHPGARLAFTAGAQTAAGDPIPDAAFDAELFRPDGTRQPLPLARDGDHTAGSLDNLQLPGDYRIEVTAKSQDKNLGSAQATFQVMDHDVELSNPAADPDQLARLANWTRESGGRAVPPEHLPALLEEIQQRPEDVAIEVQTKWQLADTPFDAWLFFLLVLALLTSEWALRKKWGLV